MSKPELNPLDMAEEEAFEEEPEPNPSPSGVEARLERLEKSIGDLSTVANFLLEKLKNQPPAPQAPPITEKPSHGNEIASIAQLASIQAALTAPIWKAFTEGIKHGSKIGALSAAAATSTRLVGDIDDLQDQVEDLQAMLTEAASAKKGLSADDLQALIPVFQNVVSMMPKK